MNPLRVTHEEIRGICKLPLSLKLLLIALIALLAPHNVLAENRRFVNAGGIVNGVYTEQFFQTYGTELFDHTATAAGATATQNSEYSPSRYRGSGSASGDSASGDGSASSYLNFNFHISAPRKYTFMGSASGEADTGSVQFARYAPDNVVIHSSISGSGTSSSGSGTLLPGDYVIGAVAGNGYGSASWSFYLALDNTPPVANDQSFTNRLGVSVPITLSASDTEGDFLTYQVVTFPSHGLLIGAPPNLIYTPNADYYGLDSFTFKANDGKIDSNIATVSAISFALDLQVGTLVWNTTLGGVDFTYSVANGPLISASTAKLFWANGTAIANILSSTPIFPHDIPAGFSGQSATIHVPSAAFGTPPEGTTYLLLVVDRDNTIAESNEGNNTGSLGPSTVADFPPYAGPTDNKSLSAAAPLLASAVAAFQSDIAGLPGSPTSGISAVYRPFPYQQHLHNIKKKFDELLKVPGVVSDPIPYYSGGNQKYRPRLAIRPGTPGMLCKKVVDHANAESSGRFLVGVGPNKVPGVNPPDVSKHTDDPANAVDINIRGQITAQRIQQLANAHGLCRPTSENHHFELGTVNNAAFSLGATVVGNSPINILVTDPSGKRIGFDPSTGSDLNEIGGPSSYSGAGSEPQVVEIPPGSLVPGSLAITGVGTGSGGPYTITLLVSGENAEDPVERLLSTGTASPGADLAPVPAMDSLAATLQLASVPIPGGLLLHWPTWVTNCVLEAAPAAYGPWTPVTGVDYQSQSHTVTNVQGGSVFFRLAIPR